MTGDDMQLSIRTPVKIDEFVTQRFNIFVCDAVQIQRWNFRILLHKFSTKTYFFSA